MVGFTRHILSYGKLFCIAILQVYKKLVIRCCTVIVHVLDILSKMQKCTMFLIFCFLFVVSLLFSPVKSECKAGKVNVNVVIDKYLPYIEKTLPTITLNVKHGENK